MYCVQIGPSVGSETIGSNPPSGLTNRVGCLLYIFCSESVYIEAHEPSLTTHRLKLSLNYILKLKSLPENLAYSCVFESENTKLFEESESKVPPLGISHLLAFSPTWRNPNLT